MSLSPIPAALRLLANEKNLAADAAIVDALPAMNPAAQQTALDILAKRGHSAALTRLISGFAGFDANLRSLIAERMHSFHHAVRVALNSPTLDSRLAAIHAIRASHDARCAYLLADAVKNRCPRTRDAAGHVLKEFTAQALDSCASISRITGAEQERSSAIGISRLDSLADAMRSAIQNWELHCQPAVLEASLWLGERTDAPFRAKLDQPHTKIAHAINDLFASTCEPRLAGALLRALAHSATRATAARSIVRNEDMPFVAALCDHIWLFCDTEVAHGARWLQDTRTPPQWGYLIGQLPERIGARAIRLIDAVGGSPQRRLEVLRALLDTDREEVRRAILWRLVEDDSPNAADVLNVLAGRSADPLAELAARELHRRELRLAVGEVKPSPSFEPGSKTSDVPDALEKVFAQFDLISREACSDECARLRKEVPDLTRRLREKLSSTNTRTRARTLHLVALLHAAQELEEQIYSAVRDPDPVVRSLAINLLMELPGKQVAPLLRAALSDVDPRVQANAVEVMDRLNISNRGAALAGKLESPHSRVRANAVKALLRMDVRSAADALLNMLQHNDRGQRLSALWVVERMQLRSVLDSVESLQHSDPDERIRARAARVVRQILSESAKMTPHGSLTRRHALHAEKQPS